jgi:hypothetical protein
MDSADPKLSDFHLFCVFLKTQVTATLHGCQGTAEYQTPVAAEEG